jgi:uncharacterized iron-regulated membrane protein
VRWGLLLLLLAALAGVAHAQQDTRQQAVVPLPGGTQQRVEAVEAAGEQQVEAVVLAPGEQQRVRAVVEPTPLEAFASHAAEATAAIFGATVSIAMTIALLLFV